MQTRYRYHWQLMPQLASCCYKRLSPSDDFVLYMYTHPPRGEFRFAGKTCRLAISITRENFQTCCRKGLSPIDDFYTHHTHETQPPPPPNKHKYILYSPAANQLHFEATNYFCSRPTGRKFCTKRQNQQLQQRDCPPPFWGVGGGVGGEAWGDCLAKIRLEAAKRIACERHKV